jgi:hypothetical protein
MEIENSIHAVEAPPNSLVEVRDSAVAGKGCFTTKPIRKGETIHFLRGDMLTGPEVDKRILNGEVRPDDELQIGENLFFALDSPSYFFNHSCEPNGGIRGASELFALRDINKGEEVTYDYATTVGVKRDPSWLLGNNDWNMSCQCGSEKCRGEIKPVTSIPAETLDNYVKHGALPGFVKFQLLELVPTRYAMSQ